MIYQSFVANATTWRTNINLCFSELASMLSACKQALCALCNNIHNIFSRKQNHQSISSATIASSEHEEGTDNETTAPGNISNQENDFDHVDGFMKNLKNIFSKKDDSDSTTDPSDDEFGFNNKTNTSIQTPDKDNTKKFSNDETPDDSFNRNKHVLPTPRPPKREPTKPDYKEAWGKNLKGPSPILVYRGRYGSSMPTTKFVPAFAAYSFRKFSHIFVKTKQGVPRITSSSQQASIENTTHFWLTADISQDLKIFNNFHMDINGYIKMAQNEYHHLIREKYQGSEEIFKKAHPQISMPIDRPDLTIQQRLDDIVAFMHKLGDVGHPSMHVHANFINIQEQLAFLLHIMPGQINLALTQDPLSKYVAHDLMYNKAMFLGIEYLRNKIKMLLINDNHVELAAKIDEELQGFSNAVYKHAECMQKSLKHGGSPFSDFPSIPQRTRIKTISNNYDFVASCIPPELFFVHDMLHETSRKKHLQGTFFPSFVSKFARQYGIHRFSHHRTNISDSSRDYPHKGKFDGSTN